MAALPAIPEPTSHEVAELDRLGVSRESRAALDVFLRLLWTWQERTNLVSPASLPHVWTRHVIDSLQILPLLEGPPGAIADLGSGGGFPGLPLAVASGRKVRLHESNGKKAAFLREALRMTGGQGEVWLGRLEAAPKPPAHEFAYVTARALAPLTLLLSYAEPFLNCGAMAVFHKGKDLSQELTESAKCWRIKADRLPSSTDSEAELLLVKEAIRV